MEEFIEQVLTAVRDLEGVASASRIEGEDAIGVELDNGEEYFLDFSEA